MRAPGRDRYRQTTSIVHGIGSPRIRLSFRSPPVGEPVPRHTKIWGFVLAPWLCASAAVTLRAGDPQELFDAWRKARASCDYGFTLEEMEDDHRGHRRHLAARYALVHAGSSAVHLLMEHLREDGFNDTFHGKHSETMKLLEKIGAGAVDPLVEALRRELRMWRATNARDDGETMLTLAYTLILILEVIEDPRAVPVFLEVLEGPYPPEWKTTVLAAISTLPAGHHQDRLHGVVRHLLISFDEWDRRLAIVWLGEHGDASDVERLLDVRDCLKQPDLPELADSLYLLGSEEWVSTLELAREREAEEYSDSVVDVLPRFADFSRTVPLAIRWLEEAAEEEAAKRRDGKRSDTYPPTGPCLWALREITYQSFGGDPSAWKTWWRENAGKPREAWLDQAAAKLLEEASSDDEAVRVPAMKRLVELAPRLSPSRRRDLAAVARDRLERQVSEWRDEMRQLGIPDVSLASDVWPYVDDSVIEALFRVGKAEALEFVETLLARLHTGDRLHGLSLFSYNAAGLPTETLDSLLDHPDPALRCRAAWELIGRGYRPALRVLIDLTADPRAARKGLDVDQLVVRLRELTHKDFGYRADLSPEAKEAALRRWRTWWGEEGGGFDLEEALHWRRIDENWSI